MLSVWQPCSIDYLVQKWPAFDESKQLSNNNYLIILLKDSYKGFDFPAESLSEVKSKIHLNCLSERDAGLYECVAQNEEGRQAVQTEVHVVSECFSDKCFSQNLSFNSFFRFFCCILQAQGSGGFPQDLPMDEHLFAAHWHRCSLNLQVKNVSTRFAANWYLYVLGQLPVPKLSGKIRKTKLSPTITNIK